MGYTTEFNGELSITPALTPEQVAYLDAFASIRHMNRDATQALALADTRREAVKLPIGAGAQYYVGSVDDGNFGQGKALFGRGEDDGTILEYNEPPKGQPGLWCQWEVSKDGTRLYWNGAEKFYHYEEWLAYLIEHFFKRWERTLNGQIEWRGEDWNDTGTIVVTNNRLITETGRTY